MESINNKVTSNDSSSRVERIMESAHKRFFTAGGAQGFFVDKGDFAYLEEVLSKGKDMRNHVTLADSELARLRESLTSLHAANDLSEKKLKDMQEHLDSSYGKLQRAESERAKALADANAARDEKKRLKDELVKSKAEWEDHVKRLEFQTVASDLSDPVDLKTVKDELTIARRHVKEAQSELERLNTNVSKSNQSVTILTREKEFLQKAYDDSVKQYNTINAAWESAQALSPEPEVVDTLARIKLDEGVKKLIGAKSFDWLTKLQQVPTANVRDTTFHLLGAARESSNKQVSKLTALLQKVFEWVKEHSNKMRDKLKPWLDTIAKDIASGKVKTMAFYRSELEKLVADFKVVQEKAATKLNQKVEEVSFMTNASSWVKVLFYYRPKRYFSKGVGFVKSTFGKCMKSLKSVLSGIASYFNSSKKNRGSAAQPPRQGPSVSFDDASEYDADSMIHVEPIPEVEPHTPTPPPPPPAPKPSGSFVRAMSEKAFGKQKMK
ncbi:hypothetical protein [Botrytis cinerea fusarivirus 5]|uniref:Uncharacterized protein n=1 Tax=Botrytis cinerea fusarivirus 5 TaxID=2735921 RepID=A0AAE7DRW5_9VIRU|nr:hypothetical protein QKS28_gp2 [Botrytis cinerea fusarivirus 5]QJT73718.1 hypothetical protein [Botrytis cinerea fusarivirus 5]